jgi:hypothetical protein
VLFDLQERGIMVVKGHTEKPTLEYAIHHDISLDLEYIFRDKRFGKNLALAYLKRNNLRLWSKWIAIVHVQHA